MTASPSVDLQEVTAWFPFKRNARIIHNATMQARRLPIIKHKLCLTALREGFTQRGLRRHRKTPGLLEISEASEATTLWRNTNLIVIIIIIIF